MNNARSCLWKRILLAGGLLLVSLAFYNIQQALAQDDGWSEPQVISTPPGVSWFPDVAADAFGSTHIVWCQTIPKEKAGLQEQVYYTRWDGTEWLEPNDIVAPSPDIVRNAIATDRQGNAHLLFGGSVHNPLSLYHQAAPVNDAWSAATWSSPHRISQGVSYMGDMVIDSQDTIHIIYDDTLGYTAEEQPIRSDIFYRHSNDGGQTWTRPLDLALSPLTGSSRPSIELDSSDTLHVTWDEGWDRLSGKGLPEQGVYVSSANGGETWTPAQIITYPETTVAQLTAGSDGRGGVMLVWRATSRPEFFYQWSTDGGHSWGEPDTIPKLITRAWDTPFDMYDMAADGAGNIHLLTVGRKSLEPQAPLGVYHLTWDGSQWITPTHIFTSTTMHPEYPKIAVQENNQLHAVWFTREGSFWDQAVNRQVWHSTNLVDAPHQATLPLPTPTSPPPRATAHPIPTPSPRATVDQRNTGLADGLYTDHDDVLQLVKVLSPLALILLLAILIKTRGLRNLRN